MPEKNMLNTVTTLRPARREYGLDQRLAYKLAIPIDDALAGRGVINSPTSRKNGIAISASVSIPLNSWVISEASDTCVNIAPISTPAIREKATGTPI